MKHWCTKNVPAQFKNDTECRLLVQCLKAPKQALNLEHIWVLIMLIPGNKTYVHVQGGQDSNIRACAVWNSTMKCEICNILREIFC